jgi:ornithine decarboxylase
VPKSVDPQYETVRDVVRALDPSYPVYCVRPDALMKSAHFFLDAFPGRVMYAVKCNPHPIVLRALHKAGIRHFDTASLAEVALIREMFQNADAYFMHPVKARAAIRTAREVYNVDHWVVDDMAELDKLTATIDGGDGQVCLVRLKTQSFGAVFNLSDKFGAAADEAVALLKCVEAAGFQAGLAFHIGSQCLDPAAFAAGLETVAEVMRKAQVPIHYLDVGGGFPAAYEGHATPPLADFVAAIEHGLAGVRRRGDCVLMCEPGRALVANGVSLLTQVHLRKGDSLYINDGVYHSLSESVAGGIRFPVRLIRKAGESSAAVKPFTVFGPTCDSHDVLKHPIALPEDVGEGDWIEFGQTGAYSNAMTTRFNGFFPETYVTVAEQPLLPG